MSLKRLWDGVYAIILNHDDKNLKFCFWYYIHKNIKNIMEIKTHLKKQFSKYPSKIIKYSLIIIFQRKMKAENLSIINYGYQPTRGQTFLQIYVHIVLYLICTDLINYYRLLMGTPKNFHKQIEQIISFYLDKKLHVTKLHLTGKYLAKKKSKSKSSLTKKCFYKFSTYREGLGWNSRYWSGTWITAHWMGRYKHLRAIDSKVLTPQE